MGLLLIAAGGAFALLFILNALLQTLRRRPQLGFWHTALAFLAVLLPLVGLILANLNPEPNPLAERASLALAGALFVSGLALSLLEWFRPERLKASRGVLAAGAGMLLLVASFSVPFTAAYTLLSLPPTPTLPVAAAARGTAAPTSAADEQEQARAVFREVLRIIADQAGMQPETVAVRLDQGDTVAEIVTANGGDLDRVVSAITEIMREQIRLLAADQRLNAAQAALALSQMDTIIRFAVNRRFEDSRLTAFLSGTPIATEPVELSATAPAQAPTGTPTPTSTVTPSRTPAPPTATPTRWQYATRTPTPTATLPAPCLALTLYNLNLRAAPNREAAIQLTIPYNTTVMVYGRTADSGWWFVEYDGQTGWVDGQYVQAATACAALPARAQP